MPLSIPTFSFIPDVSAALSRGKAPAIELVGPWGSAKALAAVQAARALNAPMVVIAPGRIEAEGIFDDLATFAGEDKTLLLPAWEVLPSDAMNPSDDIVAERMNTLKRLAAARARGEALCLVLPVRALLQRVVDPKRLAEDMLVLRAGTDHAIEDMLERLIKMGYTREVMVENRGEVSVRGGIVDIFPISSELPYRIEFFGDEIDSIRRFEPETQRSVEQVQEIQILPRSEKSLLVTLSQKGAGLAPITDYLPPNTLVVIDEPLAVLEEANRVMSQAGDSPYHLSWEDAEAKMAKFPRLSLAQVAHDKAAGAKRILAPMQSLQNWGGHTQDFWEQLKQWDLAGYSVHLLCVNSGERRRLHELLEERGYRLGQGSFDLHVEIGRLRAGFASAAQKLAVLSEREMFGRHYVRRARRRFEAGAAITQFSDLKSGDYIVHALHGIGRYLGLRRFEGKPGDFMTLQYSGGDTMFLPVTRIDEVQKYVGGDGAVPKVDKLGGATWSKAKAKVKKAVRDMTEELVKLYAARESCEGHAFAPDTPWQVEFEDAFEYDETPDQLRAIADVKRDMESAKPMDRLLCGDVGYGKTEVALRAAFKCVMDGRQAALLAPTTVLAQQHYATFSERMADFPIRVELLNRFKTEKEQNATIERLKSGEVDVVIGTHRILSKDVSFKNIGLIIVDEEQRFGVAHKERLKQIRTHVDVLTLSATPIPRTLHLSLIGVRDMSAINTAPNDRLPIHTCVEAHSEELIREAIERELNREGQVFYLHNRVQTIEKTAGMIQKLVPRARIAVGHGQMAKHELEEVMTAFIEKKVDILVCTTIIGSGIDIPNANTIIVERADTFGLSELYQIRGRVGRYKHRAFAYLLIPGDRALSEEAQQRLKALEDFSSLGAGFRIAMRDLEIRGAGNLLGGEQSGHVVAVGYETYKDLIAEAVGELKGQPVRAYNLPPFDGPADAFIPEEYVPTAQQKMTLYRRVAGVHSVEEVDEITAEIQDRFGPIPGPVTRLLNVMRCRALAFEAGAKAVSLSQGVLMVEFEHAKSLTRYSLDALRREFGPSVQFDMQKRPALTFKTPAEAADPLKPAIKFLQALCAE